MLRRLLGIYFKQDDGAGSGSGNDDPDSKGDGKGADDGGGDKGSEGSDKGGEPQFTSEQQTRIDNIVKERLDRQQKKLRADWEKEQKDTQDKAKLGEVERLKAEAADKEAKTNATLTEANKRVMNAEAKVIAAALGVKPERVGYAVKLADLSAVEFNDDGEPDAKAITAAVQKVVTDLPELKGGGDGKGGSDFSGGSKPSTVTEEEIANMTPEELNKRMPEVEAFYKAK